VFRASTDVAEGKLDHLNPQTQEGVLGGHTRKFHHRKFRTFRSAAPDTRSGTHSSATAARAAQRLAP
jgi:hypothetical protein